MNKLKLCEVDRDSEGPCWFDSFVRLNTLDNSFVTQTLAIQLLVIKVNILFQQHRKLNKAFMKLNLRGQFSWYENWESCLRPSLLVGYSSNRRRAASQPHSKEVFYFQLTVSISIDESFIQPKSSYRYLKKSLPYLRLKYKNINSRSLMGVCFSCSVKIRYVNLVEYSELWWNYEPFTGR